MEITGTMPDLGCGRSNAQLGSDLFERQHAFFLEPLISSLQSVLPAKAPHHSRVDGFLFAGTISALSENRCDLRIGIVVQ
jgi:hypothetical protein